MEIFSFIFPVLLFKQFFIVLWLERRNHHRQLTFEMWLLDFLWIIEQFIEFSSTCSVAFFMQFCQLERQEYLLFLTKYLCYFHKEKQIKLAKIERFLSQIFAFFDCFFNFFYRQECLKEPIDTLEDNGTDFTAFHSPKGFFSFLLAFGEISLEVKLIRWVSTLG